MVFAQRRRRALMLCRKLGVDCLLISTQPDLRYLSGFTGSAGALVLRQGGSCFFTDGRYAEQARAEVIGVRVRVQQRSATAAATEWLYAKGVRRCGIEATRVTLAERDDWQKLVPARDRRGLFRPVRDLVLSLRKTKDAEEVVTMRRAAAIGDRLFADVLAEIAPGRAEQEIADFLWQRARALGADAMSFDTIVASGTRSALPHGRASSAKMPRRGFVTLDFGVVCEGYCSDMTRTVHLGRPDREERDVYDSVLEAQQRAMEATRSGVSAESVDMAAREILRRDGWSEYFTHSTGHGVGLEIHENPKIGLRQTEPLTQGMVVTIEPGVYLPQRFGVRIEDMVVVTADGCELLTGSTKAWIEL